MYYIPRDSQSHTSYRPRDSHPDETQLAALSLQLLVLLRRPKEDVLPLDPPVHLSQFGLQLDVPVT